MGLAMVDDSLPVLKQNNAILAFDEKEAKLMEPLPCIRCGKCVQGMSHEADAHLHRAAL